MGYKVRFKSEFQRQTGRIMYCTNGILLQQFKSDPNLSNYTHVIIDEAHERDINTDLLLNMLKDVLKQNPALKLIIMSATINTELFQKYFESSCLIHIPGNCNIFILCIKNLCYSNLIGYFKICFSRIISAY